LIGWNTAIIIIIIILVDLLFSVQGHSRVVVVIHSSL